MIVECPACKSRYRLGDDKAGQEGVRVKCSKCQTLFDVAPPVEPAGTADSPAGSGGKGTILVCDDAAFFRTLVSDVLTGAGYAVETAETGQEALSKVAELNPDALVLDIQLPDMTGFEIIKKIRSSHAWKHLPILAVSGVFTDSSDIMNMEEIGADDYIGKKFKPESLIRRVERILRSGR